MTTGRMISKAFLAGGLVAFAIALIAHVLGGDVFGFFKQNMRASFFAGFLTIGGFMLTLKTFVLVKMKEGLYSSKAYLRLARDMRALGSPRSLYEPLRELSHLLFFSILSALATSALQLTVGLAPFWWAAAICVTFAGGTLTLLVFSLVQMKGNLDAWFDCLDEDDGDGSGGDSSTKL